MKLTIGKKLYLGYGSVLVIVLVIIIYNTLQIKKLGELQKNTYSAATNAIESEHARRVGYKILSVIQAADFYGYTEELKKRFEEYVKESEEVLGNLETNASNEKEKEFASSGKKSIMEGIRLFREEMIPLLNDHNKKDEKKQAQVLMAIDEVLSAANSPIREVGKSKITQAEKEAQVYNTTTRQIFNVSISIAIFAVFVSIAIAFFITRGITSALTKVVSIIQKIARGNLNVTFDEKILKNSDETGLLSRNMLEMTDKLKETISYSLEASENVSSGSTQLSSASQGISQGASEQAASVEEISASIEEMSASINQNADNANQTEKIALKSSNDAREGGEAVQRTVIAMKSIAEKISIIQEIARQTNLLSLNASIEAARAGEHGKGFAVVASAVQKLAERSQEAAEEINKLSKSSVEVAEKAGEMLNKIVPDIQKTAELVAEINAASAEQNKGIQQVNTAVQQFNNVVQSNASASEQLASTSEELSSQAEELKNRLAFFQVDQSSFNINTRKNQVRQKSVKNTINGVHKFENTESQIHFTSKDDSTGRNVKSGIELDMSDDDDSNFQRM